MELGQYVVYKNGEITSQKYSTSPVKSDTIGFETQEENEAVYVKNVAEAIGTDHTEFYISNNDLLLLLKDFQVYFDEPFSDSSQLPTMLVSKLARKDVSVVLSGDGGDELFCGYDMYDWVHKAQRLDFVGDIAYGFSRINSASKWLPDKAYAFILNRSPEYKAQLFTDVRARYVDDLLLHNQMNPKYDSEKNYCRELAD